MFKNRASIDRETLLDILNQLDRYQKGGIPPGEALTILKAGTRKANSRRFLQTLQESAAISRGLVEGLAQYPGAFYPFLTDLLRGAEKEDRGLTMLQQCAGFLESITVLDRFGKSALKKVIYYPLVVMFILFFMMAILLINVIPAFEYFFQSFGAELPGLTLGVIALSHWFSNYWWIIIGAVLFIYILWRNIKYKDRWPPLADLSGRLWRRIPVVGAIYAKIALMRFLRTVAFMLAEHKTLPEALSAAAVAVDPPYDRALQRVQTQICGGQSLMEALQQEGLFDRQIIEAASIGERTQTLAAVFDVLADQYQHPLKSPLLARHLEVILMVLVILVVGICVIAMYLPIFKLSASV